MKEKLQRLISHKRKLTISRKHIDNMFAVETQAAPTPNVKVHTITTERANTRFSEKFLSLRTAKNTMVIKLLVPVEEKVLLKELDVLPANDFTVVKESNLTGTESLEFYTAIIALSTASLDIIVKITTSIVAFPPKSSYVIINGDRYKIDKDNLKDVIKELKKAVKKKKQR